MTAHESLRIGLDFNANYSPLRRASAVFAATDAIGRLPGANLEIRVDPEGMIASRHEGAERLDEVLAALGDRDDVQVLRSVPEQEWLERWLYELDVLVAPAMSSAIRLLAELADVFGTRLVTPAQAPQASSIVARYGWNPDGSVPFEQEEMRDAILKAAQSPLPAFVPARVA